MNHNVRHQVVIIGGGFGGLAAARFLRSSQVDVTLIDRRNFHLFQPLLYQVATGELSPANIASPLRAIVRGYQNCRVLLGLVTDIDPHRKLVHLAECTIPYDSLIVAAGSRHTYFGHDEWERFAPPLKTIEDATEIRKRILFAFEAAERETDPEKIRAWLTFVIVGGGPTGVELAGALSEIAHYTLANDFRTIDPADAQILLVEAADHPLSMYSPTLVGRAEQALDKLNITLRTNCKVLNIDDQHVTVQEGDTVDSIPARTVIWAAGVAASPLGRKLAEQTEVTTDRSGRISVQPDLSLPGFPSVIVIGDLCLFPHQNGRPLPGLAPVAMQQGQCAARNILRRLKDQPPLPFRYRDRGSMAVIGRYSAIAQMGKRQLSGLPAWLVWLLIHLMQITQFRNRLMVLVQWGWTFLTRDRSARLITNVVDETELRS